MTDVRAAGEEGRGDDSAGGGVIMRGVGWFEDCGESSGEEGRGDRECSGGEYAGSGGGEVASVPFTVGLVSTSFRRDCRNVGMLPASVLVGCGADVEARGEARAAAVDDSA